MFFDCSLDLISADHSGNALSRERGDMWSAICQSRIALNSDVCGLYREEFEDLLNTVYWDGFYEHLLLPISRIGEMARESTNAEVGARGGTA